jgi:PadR family transcriptional regulator PadR
MTRKTAPDYEPRITHQTHRVLNAFLADPLRELSGADLIDGIGLSSGTLYPILMRLAQAKWLESRRENIDPKVAGRPARRLYRITPTGLARASALRAEAFGAIPA